jgi:hypothetical protein
LSTKAICCRIFTPAPPDYPAASVRDFCSGDYRASPAIGGGSLSGVFLVGIILSVALIPFFAFREIGRVLGERELHSLIFTDGAKAAAFQSGIRQGGR